LKDTWFVDMLTRYHVAEGTTYGALLAHSTEQISCQISHYRPSISMSLNSLIRLVWLGDNGDGHSYVGPILLQQDFARETNPAPVPVPISDSLMGTMHDAPSAGIAILKRRRTSPSSGLTQLYDGGRIECWSVERDARIGEMKP
jgi:hypothetical protein